MKNINGLYHYGISVHNILEVQDLFINVLNLELVQSREIFGDYVDDLVNVKNSKAIINFFKISNEVYLETLFWEKNENNSEVGNLKFDITGLAANHICLYVEDIEKMFNRIINYNRECLISKKIVLINSGPNTGSKVFFASFFSYIFIEFFQRSNSKV